MNPSDELNLRGKLADIDGLLDDVAFSVRAIFQNKISYLCERIVLLESQQLDLKRTNNLLQDHIKFLIKGNTKYIDYPNPNLSENCFKNELEGDQGSSNEIGIGITGDMSKKLEERFHLPKKNNNISMAKSNLSKLAEEDRNLAEFSVNSEEEDSVICFKALNEKMVDETQEHASDVVVKEKKKAKSVKKNEAGKLGSSSKLKMKAKKTEKFKENKDKSDEKDNGKKLESNKNGVEESAGKVENGIPEAEMKSDYSVKRKEIEPASAPSLKYIKIDD